MSLFDSGIRPAIDDHLLKLAAQKRDYGDYWSASSGGYCMRKLIFERLGVPHSVEDDPRKQRVFTAGHIFHDWIQGLTKDAGLSIAQEVELQDEDLMVRGHFDDLVLIEEELPDMPYGDDGKGKGGKYDPTMPEKHLILYDYKTVNSRSFTYAKENGNAMSYYHRMQLGTYLYMLRKWRKDSDTENPNELWNVSTPLKDLTEARVLKISKDDLRLDEQQLLWSDELESEVVNYWKTLNNYWQEKKVPPCTCADYEGGFMAKEKFNPYFYDGEPCSLAWMKKTAEEWKK